MNTSVLSDVITPVVPEIANYSSTKLQDGVCIKRSPLRIPSSNGSGGYSSNANTQVLFRLSGRQMADFNAMRLQFTLKSLDPAKKHYIQDGLGNLIKNITISVNGEIVEQINNFSMWQNLFYYYTSHESWFKTQGTKSGFYEYVDNGYPKPSPTGVTANAFIDTFELPLSMLGLCRSGKLFPMCLCDYVDINITLATKEQVLYSLTPNTGAGAVLPIFGKATADYEIESGSMFLLYDEVRVSDDYLRSLMKQPKFTYVFNTYDAIQQVFNSNNNQSILISDAKTKTKAVYCLFRDKANASGYQMSVYANPLLRAIQAEVGGETFPNQRLGGRSNGSDIAFKANNQEIYDQFLESLGELQNPLSMGIIPFANQGSCSGGAMTSGASVLQANQYLGAKFVVGVNLEANQTGLQSGTDTKSSGGVFTLNVETEPLNVVTQPWDMLVLVNYERAIQWVGDAGSRYMSVAD